MVKGGEGCGVAWSRREVMVMVMAVMAAVEVLIEG
jgi:hypothetical protein